MRPPLTLLYVPADRPERMVKALNSGADAVIVDLEDAVATGTKKAARANLRTILTDPPARVAVQVRINGHGTPWHEADLAAVRLLPAQIGVRIPKCEDLTVIASTIAELQGRAVHLLIETALGVERAYDLASIPHVSSIALGEQDVLADLGIDDAEGLRWQRSRIINAAAAAGLPPPAQSVYPLISDDDGLRASTTRGRALGFLGRMALHPRQLPIITEVFTPTAEQVVKAREVVAAAETGETGFGAAMLPDGRFIDEALLKQARRTLSRDRGTSEQ